jgi:hypothetical protein
MITLILSNFIQLTDTQAIIAYITLAIDTVTAIVLFIKAIKSKTIKLSDITKYLQSVKGRKALSDEIGKFIQKLEKEQAESEEKESEEKESEEKESEE